ncbi:MAG: [NiFe]-hydrogenase assembly chaperone HybE [Pseudomonadota bacterium]
MSGFEGSYLGDADRIAAATPMECGVCWWVYDPAVGDPEWQIEPGVAFADLPGHWRCPHCDARQDQFMVYGVEATLAESERTLDQADEHRNGAAAGAASAAEVLRKRLQVAYAGVSERMRQLPVYNRALTVEIGRLVPAEEGLVGVAITPWAMNLVWFPYASDSLPREGTQLDVRFPSGSYGFTVAYLEDVGRFATCSLFSPMSDFQQLAVARTVAGHALRDLFKAPTARAGAPPKSGVSRRELLRGGKTAVRA